MSGVTTPARRTRWSKDAIRALAWIASGVTFLASGTVLAETPTPVAARGTEAPPAPPTIIHRIERRIIVDPPTVVVGPGSGTSDATSTAPSGTGGASGGQPAPPPVTTTGGS